MRYSTCSKHCCCLQFFQDLGAEGVDDAGQGVVFNGTGRSSFLPGYSVGSLIFGEGGISCCPSCPSSGCYGCC